MKQKIRVFLIASCDLAFVLVFFWFSMSVSTHGTIIWVSVANMFAFHIFLLLIPFALIGILFRVKRLQFASFIALGLFLFMFGNFLIPKQKPAPSSSAVLRVMTYNMLVYTRDISSVVNVIKGEDADIIFVQETSFAMADLLERHMKEEFPYQIHSPSDVPSGLSIISKYPFKKLDYDLGDSWVGKPILLDVTWNEQIVHIVNFHMDPTSFEVLTRPNRASEIAETRLGHAGRLVEFLQTHPGPAILAGDANDVFPNDPYILLINSGLQDVWAKAGFGIGHTFPGSKKIGTVSIPNWLVRIDYIFVTSDWEVLSANLAGTDGASDHRAVIATLQLRK